MPQKEQKRPQTAKQLKERIRFLNAMLGGKEVKKNV